MPAHRIGDRSNRLAEAVDGGVEIGLYRRLAALEVDIDLGGQVSLHRTGDGADLVTAVREVDLHREVVLRQIAHHAGQAQQRPNGHQRPMSLSRPASTRR